MPQLERLLRGAYTDNGFVIDGQTYSLAELIQYLLDNSGGGPLEQEVTEGTGAPSAPPGSGDPLIYQDTISGDLYVWDGSSWNQVTGTVEDDITEGSGAPSVPPVIGEEPLVYQDTDSGNLYVWNGTQWVLAGSSYDDITEGSGAPSGAPNPGEPSVYQDTDNGNLYIWNGVAWVQITPIGVTASNGLSDSNTGTDVDVELGGTLEKETTVNGDGSFGLTLDEMLKFRVNADGGSETITFLIDPVNGGVFLQRQDGTILQRFGLKSSTGGSYEASMENIEGSIISFIGSKVAGDALLTASFDGSNAIGFGANVIGVTPEVSVVTKAINDGTALEGQVPVLTDKTNGVIEYQDVPGGLHQYEAEGVAAFDAGAFLTATKLGATYERTGGSGQNTEGTLTVPEGTILRGVSVHMTAAQAPGTTFYLNVDYQETGKAVNGSQNTVMPALATVTSKPATFTDVNPATNFVHSGTPLQVGIAQVDDNGTRTRIRYKITNYAQQVGASASIVTFFFP